MEIASLGARALARPWFYPFRLTSCATTPSYEGGWLDGIHHTRSAMLDNLNQDYVRTARSKGLSERHVVVKHALRNSLIPVVTLVALGIPQIFQGAIITEQIFRVNGLGQLLILAIQGGDLPTVQALTFIFAVLIVIFNVIADVLYALLDPRIAYS